MLQDKEYFRCRCLTDYSTSGGPIIALFYSMFPVLVSAFITVCYIGVWITIQVTVYTIMDSKVKLKLKFQVA